MALVKNIIFEEIFRKEFAGNQHEIRVSDLPKDLRENDIIDISREEGFYSENNSYDPYTILLVGREREETDEEFEIRKLEHEELEKERKANRFKQYQKLKKEFEQ